MTACGPLYRANGDGVASYPSQRVSGQCGPVVGGVAAQGFRPVLHGTEGRKKKQDKSRGRRWLLRPVTSARSAGSYGGFSGDRKWGQKQTAGISFRVTFPESLETRRKSRGHTGDIQGFLLRCHTVPAGAPLRNCGAENKIGFQPDSQVVTFLIIDA